MWKRGKEEEKTYHQVASLVGPSQPHDFYYSFFVNWAWERAQLPTSPHQ